MKIMADDEGKKVLHQLCDLALKMGGLNNMQAVNTILNSIELIKEDKKSESKGDTTKQEK